MLKDLSGLSIWNPRKLFNIKHTSRSCRGCEQHKPNQNMTKKQHSKQYELPICLYVLILILVKKNNGYGS